MDYPNYPSSSNLHSSLIWLSILHGFSIIFQRSFIVKTSPDRRSPSGGTFIAGTTSLVGGHCVGEVHHLAIGQEAELRHLHAYGERILRKRSGWLLGGQNDMVFMDALWMLYGCLMMVGYDNGEWMVNGWLIMVAGWLMDGLRTVYMLFIVLHIMFLFWWSFRSWKCGPGNSAEGVSWISLNPWWMDDPGKKIP